MKKLLLFTAVVIMILLAGCTHKAEKPKVEEKTTKLTINNQSSAEFVYDIIEQPFVTTIRTGNSFTEELSKGLNGYIHLEARWPDYYESRTRRNVRSHGLIVVEEGQHKTITITDNTLVVPKGETTPITIENLKPSVLHIKFNSTAVNRPDIISYNGIWVKAEYVYSEYFIVCNSSAEDCIGFDFEDLPVQTLAKINIEKGKAKELIITDNTDITIYDKKYTVRQLKNLHILTVTNNSSAVIKNLVYRDYKTNDLYEGTLSKGELCNLSSYNFYNEGNYELGPELEFTIITRTGKELRLTTDYSYDKTLKIYSRHKDFSVNDYIKLKLPGSNSSSAKMLIDWFND